MMPGTLSLKKEMKAQTRASALAMLSGISAAGLTMLRPVFGQAVTPAKGSILASPVMGHWDPNPDYFFHWWRDAAVVMGAINTLSRTATGRAAQEKWNGVFADAVDFNLRAMAIDGRRFQTQSQTALKTAEKFRQHLRTDADMARLLNDEILADTRVNPDGTPDILTWARPQYDGPALLAVAGMEHARIVEAQGRKVSPDLLRLIDETLGFTRRHADRPGIDLWEVDGNIDRHYYTGVIQLAAMAQGAAWAGARGQAENAGHYRRAAARLCASLDGHWSASMGVYKTARKMQGPDAFGVIDASAVLACNLARLPGGRHSVRDDRIQATVAKLEELFAGLYPLNHARSEGIAIGRSRDDNFFGNNPWYWTTAGVAEFYYRLAADVKANGPLVVTPVNDNFCKRAFARAAGSQADMLIARGDAQMDLIRAYTPQDRSFAEQFSKTDGQPVSARHLGMSYAGYINAASCRP